MKKLLYLFLAIATITSCKKDPCDGIVCQNGGGCNSNGDCTCQTGFTGTFCETQMTPQYMRINSVVLLDYPTTNSSGSGYDLSTGPDIYISLNPGISALGDNAWFKSGYYSDCVPAQYTFSSNAGFPVDIPNVTSNWTIAAYDLDDFDDDDYICGIYFPPSYYYTSSGTFPSTIDLQVGSAHFQLSVSWIF